MAGVFDRVGADLMLTDLMAFAVDPAVAALAVAALLMVAAALIAVLSLRRRSERLAAAAESGIESLRASFREQLADRDRQIQTLRDERDRQVGELRAALEARMQDNAGLQARLAAMRAGMDEQRRQADANLERFQQARQQLRDEFKALAGDVLKAQSETFTKQNREQVDLLLKPLGDKIAEFQSGLMKDRAELVAQVKSLHATSLGVAQEATNLTRALKANAQVQGAWGEMILTSILERSGLRQGEQFRVQESHSDGQGGRVRTDVEVLLPNEDVIIIDSKVSLTAFEAFVNAEDEEARQASLRAHTASIRNHIGLLGSKEYHRHAGSAFDFVLMFIPIESAFAAALTAEPGLLDLALEKGVVLTTPTTLMSALRTVRNVWQVENRQRNAEEIAERAGRLYDKVVGFLENMDRVDDALQRTRKVFDNTRAQLSGGAGSVVRQVEMLRELGAKTNKRIAGTWTEGTVAEGRLAAPRTEPEPEPEIVLELTETAE